MRYLAISCALLALAACHKPAANQQTEANNTQAAEAGPVKGVDRSHKGQPFPKVKFLQDDEDGAGQMGGDSLLGEPTLVNFWASWCAPCIKELPTLKMLNASHKFPGPVIPLNQDSGTQDSVRAFMAKHGVEDLGNYQDPKTAVSAALGVEVLPTTILFDAQGKEVWRYVGDMDWTSPEAAKLLAEAGGGAKAS
jgi:thiol-disulfide isomerase/thioredoxin